MQEFVMERWQSLYENRVRHNLSESGVHPLTLAELLEMSGTGGDGAAGDEVMDTPIGYGQSNGTDPLRESIARLYRGRAAGGEAARSGERRGTEVDPDRVVVTNGSAEANFLVAWRLIEPGDEVAILTPTYGQLGGLAGGLGARVRPVPLRPANRWQPDPDDLRAAIGDGTRLVVVTNPQNPTGVTLGDDAILAIIDAADRAGAWILADEVYAGAEREDGAAETPSLLGRHPRVIATGSLSKAYGLPGLRIGWVVAPPELAPDLWARKDYTTISPGALTDALARLALRDDVRPRIIERTRSIVRDHFDLLARWLADTDRFEVPDHDAGAVCFARYDAPLDSATLADRLRTEHDVLIVPGAHFHTDPYLRFGFGIPGPDLQAALERVEALFRSL